MKRTGGNHNEGICCILDRLAQVKRSQGDVFRYKAYKVAIDTLRSIDHAITSPAEVRGLKGIGRGMQEKIEEILSTGELKQWEDVQKDPKLCALQLFTAIHGIGPVMGHKLVYERGFTSIDDLLKSDIQLTAQQRLGIKYHEDSEHKIPYAEVRYLRDVTEDILHKTVDAKLLVTVCGSHRRGVAASGDLDVLISHPASSSDSGSEYLYIHRCVEALRRARFVIDTLVEGESKFMGYCRCPDSHAEFLPHRARRFDMRWVPFDCYFPALLYFTGSDVFNTQMRAEALKIGYTLNEYGLYRVGEREGEKGEKIPVRSEEEIFRVLGQTYVPPEGRSK